jgi:hypothetical protein
VTPRLVRTAITASIAIVVLALAPGVFAASEQGDAGELRATAQDLGTEAPTTITGSFSDGSDVDMYRVCLSDGASFSATTVVTSPTDTQLFLLTSDGHGVYANDDRLGGGRSSRLPANHRFSPTQGGEYYLAISSYNRDPHSLQGEIFPDEFSTMQFPGGVVNAAGRGGEGAHAGWSGRAPGGPGSYTIDLTGTAVCDQTPPTVDLSSPADGTTVKQGADLFVDFSCADEGGSGLASCVGSVADGAKLDTSALGPVSVTVTARDGAGNETVVTSTVTVVDETAPTISIDSPSDGAAYELGEDVAANYSCADEPGGSGLATCEGTVAHGASVDTGSVGEKSFTVDATDAAGNSASKTVTYTVEDRTAPTIMLIAPADGGAYTLGEAVLAQYACEDQPGGSGVATCEGTVASGAALDTSSVGPHSFEVRTSDHAGNTATTTVTYSVVYDFRGFLWPVKNPPSTNRWKAGVPVPIRFALDGYHGARPEAAGYPLSVPCGGGAAEAAAKVAKKRPVFHYQRRAGTYTLLWKTDRRWAGTCREFVLKLDDGTVHTAQFQFAKRQPRGR